MNEVEVIVLSGDDLSGLLEVFKHDQLPKIIVTHGKPINTFKLARTKGYAWTNHVQTHFANPPEATTSIPWVKWFADFLKERAYRFPPVFRYKPKKRLTRRELLKIPGSLAENTAVPHMETPWKRLSPVVRRALSRIYCDKGAIKPTEASVDPNICDECGSCIARAPPELIGNTILPFEETAVLLRNLSRNGVKTPIVYACLDSVDEVLEIDYYHEKPVIALPSPNWISWYLPVLHEITGVLGILFCNASWREKTSSSYLTKLHELSSKTRYFKVAKPGDKHIEQQTSPIEHPVSYEEAEVDVILTLRDLKEKLYGLRVGEKVESFENTILYSHIIEFDENTCTLCGACEKACPFDAIKVEENGTEARLVFRPFMCTGCFNCLVACPENSIKSFSRDQGIRSDVILARDVILRCVSCGKPLGPSKSIRRVEERLVEKGFPPELVKESSRLCSECKSRAFLASRLR